MASIVKDPNGRKRLVVTVDDKRKIVYLGKISARDAETIRANVAEIIAARFCSRPPSDETSKWI
jgi:hypothetical protein